ncbi:hypothetical protein AAFF_G00293150 [Aldrovandia affinis]|uniref:Uncharacterized protein n=1 Tax=Aldrovandia affinis TaxID=143900 RepID=A0AAD7WST0_9TELE|nr:hypothetical protein AAFF_G00293150 [Aldrovandia affinis]
MCLHRKSLEGFTVSATVVKSVTRGTPLGGNLALACHLASQLYAAWLRQTGPEGDIWHGSPELLVKRPSMPTGLPQPRPSTACRGSAGVWMPGGRRQAACNSGSARAEDQSSGF